MIARLFFLLLALAFAGCQSQSEQRILSSSEKELAVLMRERLAYAPRIAWIKYQNGQPISDNAREAVLLKNLEAAGQKKGLDPRRVREFFSAQMAAFQQMQRDEIDLWKAGRQAPAWAPMDLQTEIRPAIEKLNDKLLALLASPGAGHSSALARYCEGSLRKAGFSAAASAKAAAPIASDLPWKNR